MIFVFHSFYLLAYYACKAVVTRRCSHLQGSSGSLSFKGTMDKTVPIDSNKTSKPAASTDDKNVATEPICQPLRAPTAFYREEHGLTFAPPVYVQRYCTVYEALKDPRWKEEIHKVVDMGCSELGFFQNLKQFEGLTEIVAVDIDAATLEYNSCKTVPLTSDYLRLRDNDLTVSVLAGSVVEFDKSLEKADAVVCIELIEHLYPQELDALPYNIFGQVRPRVAIFTTPNSDFNVLIPKLGAGFRHFDHKFEWTRDQFKDWANNLTERYPEYTVEFKGIGPGPDDTEAALGCCSQMALFFRPPNPPSVQPEPHGSPPHKMVRHSEYKMMRQTVYPARRDDRLPALKARHEAEYELHQLARQDRFETDTGNVFVPLSDLLLSVKDFFSSEAELKASLEEADWTIEKRRDGKLCVHYVNRDVTSEESQYDEDEVADSTPWKPEEGEIWDDTRDYNCWKVQNGTDKVNGGDPSESPDSDWEMGDATPRPWQSEPQLQASATSPQPGDQPPPEALMFRSVNERQIFGLRALASSSSDPIRIDDSGYPNSASVQDMDVTLGSSDDLSNSPEDDEEDEEDEPPRLRLPPSPPPPPFPPAAMPANNHDAVNNNRDYEGNDLGLDVPHQPRPRPRPPPFPRWLLLLLAEENDEGFEAGSSSSEEDEEEDDDDRHVL